MTPGFTVGLTTDCVTEPGKFGSDNRMNFHGRPIGNFLSNAAPRQVCLIRLFASHQQSFSYIGMGLLGLNQY